MRYVREICYDSDFLRNFENAGIGIHLAPCPVIFFKKKKFKLFKAP